MLAALRATPSRHRRSNRDLLFAIAAACTPCCSGITSAPFAPVGYPGRLPDVMPSSVDNPRLPVDTPVNITGLIIATTLNRYERAAAEVRKSDIRSTVWIPAVFLEERNYSMCGGGGNGLRHAMRNAWNLIASSGVGMAVFEEDVSFAVPERLWGAANASVARYIATRCLARPGKCDLAYLGQWNDFFTTHAIYIPPWTAVQLLAMTSSCYPWRAQIDQPMHARCLHRPGRVPWNCVKPPGFKRKGGFGSGFFVQDPIAVPSVLHGRSGGSSSNRAIARR